ncbi:MAG: flippase-like domain-containing protein [Anaerolineales bacterium]|nr:flippase-like domain-containing protein [Anaerolineales bacterium]
MVSKVISSTPFRVIASVLIGALTLYLSLKDVPLAQVSQAIQQVDWLLYGLVLIVVMINTAAKAARWKTLMGPLGKEMPFGKVFMGITVGHTLNVAYPARAGDVARAYVLGKRGVDKVYLLGTVALEKLLDLLAYALLIVCLALLIPLPEWIGQPLTGLVVLAIVLGAFTLVVFKKRSWIVGLFYYAHDLPTWVTHWLPRQMRTLLEAGFSSMDVMEDRRAWLKLIGWSGVVWGTAIFTNMIMFWAVHLRLADDLTVFTASLLTLLLLQVGIIVPSTPGRIGVFEYICVLALGLFGVEQAFALSYGILLHVVVFLPPILLGISALVAFGSLRERKNLVSTPRDEVGTQPSNLPESKID